MRRILPTRRECESIRLAGWHYTVSIGHFEDGAPAELFISSDMPTSETADIARDGSVLISIALQCGVPAELMRCAITRLSNGSAASVIGQALDLLCENGGGAGITSGPNGPLSPARPNADAILEAGHV